MKPILLFGGTFDPVHTGHLAIANYFCKKFQTDQLRIIPAGNPWQKKAIYTSHEHRLKMLELAFENRAIIDPQEINRDGPSYTIDTLKALRNELGDKVPLIFILGFDQFINLSTWKDWKALFQLTHFAVAKRQNASKEEIPSDLQAILHFATIQDFHQTPCGLTFLGDTPQVSISATQIRLIAKQEKFYHPLIPQAVLNYIKINNLYRN